MASFVRDTYIVKIFFLTKYMFTSGVTRLANLKEDV